VGIKNVSIDYDTIAERYDELYGLEQLGKNLAASAFLYGKETVLDAGCGTGLLSVFLKGSYYVCLDLSIGMLEVFRSRRRCLCDAIRGNINMLPFRDECVDGLACITVIHEAPGTLSGLARVLKLGGVMVLGVKERLLREPLKFPRELSVEKVLESSGDTLYVLRRVG
jgi:ubiquinone/menaquinone biosynthesis C-methylase UbiE